MDLALLLVGRENRARKGTEVRQVHRGKLVRRVLKARKVISDPSARRVPMAQPDRKVLPVLMVKTEPPAHKVRQELMGKTVRKVQKETPAHKVHKGISVPLAPPVPMDKMGRQVLKVDKVFKAKLVR